MSVDVPVPPPNKETELRLLNKELGDWISKDNNQFVRDKNIFDHGYFGFMWQVCGYVPSTIECAVDNGPEDVNLSYLQVGRARAFVCRMFVCVFGLRVCVRGCVIVCARVHDA